MTATLTLYQLDEELTSLLSYRQERVEDRDSPASSEELEAVDGAIAAYMAQLPRKVDNVASFIRHCEGLIEEDDREIARYKAHKAAVAENLERIKSCAAVVLERQPMPAKGCRKLVGAHSTLMLKGNGGVQPLVISDPLMVPDELCTWRGELSHATMTALLAAVQMWAEDDRIEGHITTRLLGLARTPSNSLIREALLQPCAGCDGEEPSRCCNGLDCGCMGLPVEPPCEACGGTGKNAVPGAHLEPRGQHVEIR